MNPLGEDTLKSGLQLWLENSAVRLSRIALGVLIIATFNVWLSIASSEQISPFWYWPAALAIVTLAVFITGLNEKIGRRWPYKVAEGNTNVYFLNDSHNVELAKPGRYWGSKKNQLFKIELEMNRRAKFTINCQWFYVGYQVRFSYQPSPEEVKSFLAWLKNLEDPRSRGQNEVLAKLKEATKERARPFQIYTKVDELGIF